MHFWSIQLKFLNHIFIHSYYSNLPVYLITCHINLPHFIASLYDFCNNLHFMRLTKPGKNRDNF